MENKYPAYIMIESTYTSESTGELIHTRENHWLSDYDYDTTVRRLEEIIAYLQRTVDGIKSG